MEKILSAEDRIRRAEEIYYRRKSQGVRVSSNTVNANNRSNSSIFKKMIIKIIICTIIYLSFYIIKNSQYIFSAQILNKTKEILNYDVDFQSAYSQMLEYVNNFKKQDSESGIENVIEGTSNENIQENIETTKEELGIGGGETEGDNIEDLNDIQNVEQKSQMEIDAEFIKQNYSLIKPVNGIVTSRFGNREATQIVSANHEGIDIGAVTGTPIYASMCGTVIEVSTVGDYR